MPARVTKIINAHNTAIDIGINNAYFAFMAITPGMEERLTTEKSRLMAPKDAAIATSLSRPLLTLMAGEGQFPAPVRLGERRIAYVRSEVEAWINARIAARPANDNSVTQVAA